MLGWLFGRRPGPPRWTIHLHGSVADRLAPVAAWTVYAGVKAMVRDGRYAALHPGARGRDTPFDEECFARNELAEFWAAQPPEVQAADSYLGLLTEVRAAGLVREYVWRYLRRPGWPEPASLDLGRLDAWMAAAGAAGHRPLTLASVAPA